MELEEAEDEEWYITTSKYTFKSNARNGCMVRRWVLKRGLCLGRKILVAGFVASAAPIVVPPLMVASAIGIAVSMPCAIFLACHACTQSLMSKLLPRPNINTYKEEQALVDEIKRDIEMVVGIQCLENGENMMTSSGSECGPQEVQVQLISGDNGVVVLEESQDQAMEGDIEEAELQSETKGLLEKIRDEGRTHMNQERGICGGENESDKKIGPVVEDTHSSIIEGTEGKEEDPNVCEEMMLHSRDDESKDIMLEGKEFDNTNDSQEPMAEPSELLIPAEPIGDMPIEALVYNISDDEEDSSEVISENIDINIVAKEEPEPPLDCPTILQNEKLDNSISDFENQESQLHELNERVYLSDEEAREIATESALDLLDGKQIDPDECGYTIYLHEESSNVEGHTDSMEVLLSSVEEEESRPSECSSGENIVCPSQEVVSEDEENIWKQINVIRKIVGYEGTMQASCSDELKALYIFTGVEPPTSLDDPAEIKEKLHFLMSIVGIKSNDA